ncbi:hypothetical protein DPMN_192624 [Dreissena polymorpha]|uniref:Uncharacterized protein n=1 Tax=Dreissena polymorpha TaxID=45954 RepID=A0A9D3Y607_DREPO|nr:hypothetical protein DPMN_192624 [Dreissena polymorpha]
MYVNLTPTLILTLAQDSVIQASDGSSTRRREVCVQQVANGGQILPMEVLHLVNTSGPLLEKLWPETTLSRQQSTKYLLTQICYL